MELAINNPGKVFICRGNHEDLDLNENYGFTAELEAKFGHDWRIELEELILDFYDAMPHVLLLGLQDPSTIHYNFILCCHGGLEFEAHNFLKQSISRHLESGDQITLITLPGYLDSMNGFNWGDFHANPNNENTENYRIAEERGNKFLSYSHYGMVQYLRNCNSDTHSILAIMRGHQHHIGGIGRLYKIPHFNNDWALLKSGESNDITHENVFTFISSPEGVGTHRDSFGILHAGPDGNWRLTPYVNNRYPEQY